MTTGSEPETEAGKRLPTTLAGKLLAAFLHGLLPETSQFDGQIAGIEADARAERDPLGDAPHCYPSGQCAHWALWNHETHQWDPLSPERSAEVAWSGDTDAQTELADAEREIEQLQEALQIAREHIADAGREIERLKAALIETMVQSNGAAVVIEGIARAALEPTDER